MNPPIDLADLEQRLRRHVEVLARAPRVPGSGEHRAAEDYIGNFLQALGFSTQDASYFEGGFACTNLLTQPLPADASLPLVIIGAHYDTVRGSPGADDNASAVAALLELARWVRPQLDGDGPFTARLQLAAYDLEEYGVIGSSIHSREVLESGADVRGMISLEMLGFTDRNFGSQGLPPHLVGMYPDVGDFIGVCGNEASEELVKLVTEGMKSVAGLPVEFIAVPGRGQMLPETRLSDHSSFWDRGLKALMITDTAFFRNPHYHQRTDTPETLDYPFLANVTAGACEAVWRLLTM
jgi:aminopeptidase YwaD